MQMRELLFTPILKLPIIDYQYLDLSDTQFFQRLRDDFGEDLEQLYEFYPGLKQNTSEARIALLGDELFGAKVRLYAEYASQNGQPVFLYQFKRTPPSSTQTVGAFHAAELPFVHGTDTPVLPLNEKDKELSRIMIDYWTNFAKTGNPNNKNCPKWEAFENTNPKWMELDSNKVQMNPIDRDRIYQILNKRVLARFEKIKLGNP